ncbi:hypothetical protein GGS20DRAFT_495458 [Poronia punctata]|nr:hypothetical protein GGS20DRAFT_495458 [Poronia punctata]
MIWFYTDPLGCVVRVLRLSTRRRWSTVTVVLALSLSRNGFGLFLTSVLTLRGLLSASKHCEEMRVILKRSTGGIYFLPPTVMIIT